MDIRENDISDYREQISYAVTWEIIFQLMRRYQVQYDLRVWETHPCSGQYNCLSLYSLINGRSLHIYDFNLQAQSLHIWRDGSYADRIDIISQYLHSSDPKKLLDKISSLAGLNIVNPLPSSNGTIIACGLIATIFKIFIFSQVKLKTVMAYCDSSGYSSHLRIDLIDKFEIIKTLLTNNISKFYKYFFINEVKDNRTLCLIDMSGKIIFPNDEIENLICLYNENGRNINKMSIFLLQKLGI